jgi:hypothetical protein
MKINKILFIATLFVAITSNAQIDKGNWMMGGSGSFSNYKSKSGGNTISETTSLSVRPNIGFFVMDKLAVGSGIGFLFFFPKGPVKSPTYYDISPFVRYYFLKKEKQINIFSETSYGIELNSLNSNTSQRLNLKAGTVFFLNGSVGIEVALNYSSQKDNQDSLNRGIYLNVGFQIHLEKE